tara:strand:- start:2699 stop:3538 length:840 start_codon:yes stop_codon:yes gene_type:complete
MLFWILNIILLFNLSLCIGLKALIIPQSASMLSTSGGGICYNQELNPALISVDNSYISLSENLWLGGVSGQKISYYFNNHNYISFENLSINDIELRNEVASESPIGFFGASWYALEMNKSFDVLFENLSFGYKVKFNYSKLFSESMHGFSVDLGINNKVNENLDIGFLIRNIGREFSDNLRLNNEILIGVGTKYFMPNLNLVFLSDFFIFEQNKYLKLSTITTLPYLNFIVGGTYSDSYKDFSFGIKLDYKKWAIVFGNLNHNNTALGSPSSIEIMKSF